MLVGIYTRVSTLEQATEGYSIGEQTDRLTRYAETMGWTVYKVYTDGGFSGGSMDRPGLQMLIKDVKARKLDKILVFKLDRFSRRLIDTISMVEEILRPNGVELVSMSEMFDTSTNTGRNMMNLLGVFAQMEREQIRERMMMGKEGRAKKGLYHGGSTIPIGYDYVDGYLVVNEYETMQVREAFRLAQQGFPMRAIEREFFKRGYKNKHGWWSHISIKRVLRNKGYLGYVHHQEQWLEGQHEPIIAEDVFNAVQAILDDREELFKDHRTKNGGHTTFLGGLVYCAQCGHRFGKRTGPKHKDGTRTTYYACYTRTQKHVNPEKNGKCSNRYWKAETLEDLVFGEIKKLSTDPEYFTELKNKSFSGQNNEDREQILRKEIEKLENQVSRLMKLYALEELSYDDITAQIKPLSETKTRLQEELDFILGEKDDGQSDEAAKELIRSFDAVIERGDFHEIRRLIEGLIERIDIDEEDITIYWRFQ